MSGWWIKLHDSRIRCDAQTDGDPIAVARALVNLYDVTSVVHDDEDDE